MSDRPVAIITGAARGIGAATARRLDAAGWALLLVDACADDPALGYPLATPAELAAVAASCTAADVIIADVRDPQAMQHAVDTAVGQFDRLDAAVAAAGAIAGGPPTWETTDATWSAMIDINLTGVFNLARPAVAAMVARSEADAAPARPRRFVAVASAAAQFGLPQLAAYTAAKHGVAGLVRALAAETAPYGITANAVSPGSTDTTMLAESAAIYGLDHQSSFADQARIGRLIEPDEIAATVAWLCSSDAGAINGAVVPVDGGFRG